MLKEYTDIIPDITASNAHFAKIFEKHNALDKQIQNVKAGREHMEQITVEGLKKEKLQLKDEAYTIILDYKKQNNL